MASSKQVRPSGAKCFISREFEPGIMIELPFPEFGRDTRLWLDHLAWLKCNHPDRVRAMFKRRSLAQYVSLIVRRAEARIKELAEEGLNRFVVLKQVYDEIIAPRLPEHVLSQQKPIGQKLDQEIQHWLRDFDTNAWDWTVHQDWN